MVELAACPARPRLLLSLGRDGNVRLWDVPSEACLSTLATDATSLVSQEMRGAYRAPALQEAAREAALLPDVCAVCANCSATLPPTPSSPCRR